MSKAQANKIFEKYNPVSAAIRCPYGRAGVRKQVDEYVRAAVNLYGIISREELVAIFNQQNTEKTTVEEIYILLLPFVLKEGYYCFYKEYLVHYFFFDHFDYVEYLLEDQADKPRYIPLKDEFLKYIIEEYEDNNYWDNVQKFIYEIFGFSRNNFEGYHAIREHLIHEGQMNELMALLDRYNFVFQNEKQIQQFLDLITAAKNNTRIWVNKGHTPSELYDISMEGQEKTIEFPTLKNQKIGRNDPCPCGSGKKYKRCCGRTSNAKLNQLSSREAKLFYETWYGLLGFVNEREGIIREKIKPEYPNRVNDIKMHKVRERLWKNPKLISEYINERTLSQEEIAILKLWETHHRKGMFFILDYQSEYAVMIAPNEEGEDRLYGVKGISNPISNVLQERLPIQVETTLLPFKGKIIYDSFFSSFPIEFGQGIREAFQEMYDEAFKHGIITRLE